eukprot:TRINITY_DN2014_c0_g1_i1.p2 TRINITY_DN2014_c0_g1~~TRINITY_DN2014_c0_g1_i1.p2  ORF type:complete len:132 (-),score=26.97 TRINITY_DN2014_c0_g1_i1:559-954(-)
MLSRTITLRTYPFTLMRFEVHDTTLRHNGQTARERKIIYMKHYRQVNKEKISEIERENYRQNKEFKKQYYQQNKQRRSIYERQYKKLYKRKCDGEDIAKRKQVGKIYRERRRCFFREKLAQPYYTNQIKVF